MARFLPDLVICCAALVISLLGAGLGRERGWALGWVAVGAVLAALGCGVWALAVRNQPLALPEWVAATISADGYALFFKLFALVVVLVVLISAVDYVRELPLRHAGEFYALLLFATLAMMLLGACVDLIAIVLCLEFLGIVCYVLTAYLKRDERSAEGGLKYFLVGSISTAVMLYGMSLVYGLSGTTNINQIALVLGQPLAFGAVGVAAVTLTLVGFAFKVALVPFHTWAPDAYEAAPTPVTAFLSVGPKAAGFAILARLFLLAFNPEVADWVTLGAGLAAVTMTVGNLVAIPQTNIKRLLAYSSIAQAGYIIIGLVCARASHMGLPGLLIYLIAYLFMNLGAFAVVIALFRRTGSDEISSYAGLIHRAPFLAISLAIFFLSLAGVPPTGGFLGKFYVFAAAIESGMVWLAVVGVVNSVISIYYYFGVVRYMFLVENADVSPVEETIPLKLAVALPLAVTLAMGLFPQTFLNLATASARALPVLGF